jgi:hypothetical protein
MAECTRCYSDYISCGNETLTVVSALEANAAYIWVITTSQGAKYSGAVTTDANGMFDIDVTTLPEGLLNPYAGNFVLTVVAADAYQCNTEAWNDLEGCDSYTCIEFDVRNGDQIKNTLGCPCGGGGGGGGITNWEDFDYDDATGTFTMLNGDPQGNRTYIAFKAYPYNGTTYVNGENWGVSAGPFDGDTLSVDRLTPGQLYIWWRIQTPSGTALTAYKTRLLTVTELSQRWYSIFVDGGGGIVQLPVVFAPLKFYNYAGALNPNVITNMTEFVTQWNLDPANADFQMDSYRGSVYLQALLIPNPASLIYPYQNIQTTTQI